MGAAPAVLALLGGHVDAVVVSPGEVAPHVAADEVVPMFNPMLLDEPVPVNGRMKASALDAPGFGVRLNPECALQRPFPR